MSDYTAWRKQFHQALQDTFPQRADLERMTDLELGVNLATITANGNLAAAAYELLVWAESHGQVENLYRAAQAANPHLAARCPAPPHAQHAPTPPPGLPPLPSPPPDFVGRAAEIELVLGRVRAAQAQGGGATIIGIWGLGGIGKTTLALTVAVALRADFPDGQLLIPLGGMSEQPLAPEAVPAAVITTFDPQTALPPSLAERQARYRQLLAGKRVLLLADDARDAEQVRPLLPLPPGCALLVTSRTHFNLPGMAPPLDLGTLPPAEATQLLRTICPRISTADAPLLAQRCGYLPLALRVSAALLRDTPARSVARHLAALADEHQRLAALRYPDDPDLDVLANLQQSWAALDAPAQAVLAQLSVFPAPFDRAAAAAVVELPEEDGDQGSGIRDQGSEANTQHSTLSTQHSALGTSLDAILEQLSRRSLLEADAEGERLGLHDLVRAFAGDPARLPEAAAEAAQLRHAQHYAGVAKQAGDRYDQGGEDMLAGLRLFDAERAQIDAGWAWARARAGSSQAVDTLLLDYAGVTVYTGMLRYDARRERIPQAEARLAAARRLGRKDAEGAALCSLGVAYRNLGDARQAIEYYEQALARARAIRAWQGEGAALGNLGLAYADLGETRRAIEYYEQHLALARAIGDRRDEGTVLGNLGLAYAALGETRRAIEYYEQHLALAHASGDRRGESDALGNLGCAYRNVGEVRQAIAYQEQALVIDRAIGDRRGEEADLGNLGIAYENLGEPERAIAYYEQALDLARAIGDRAGEAIHSWNLGGLVEQQGDPVRAVALLQMYVDFARAIGHVEAEKYAAYVEAVWRRAAERAAD